jgi:hypothetical protein
VKIKLINFKFHYFDEGQLFLTYFIHGLKYKCKQT